MVKKLLPCQLIRNHQRYLGDLGPKGAEGVNSKLVEPGAPINPHIPAPKAKYFLNSALAQTWYFWLKLVKGFIKGQNWTPRTCLSPFLVKICKTYEF